MATDAEKGLALLKSIAAKHETEDGEEDGDHAWRRCRSCLASEELGTPDGRRALRAFLKWADTLAALAGAEQQEQDAELEAERLRNQTLRDSIDGCAQRVAELASRLAASQQEQERLKAELAGAIDAAETNWELKCEYEVRLRAAEATLAKVERLSIRWAADAHEIDQDGDFCCAHTRRNDAGELFDAIKAHLPVPSTPHEEE